MEEAYYNCFQIGSFDPQLSFYLPRDLPRLIEGVRHESWRSLYTGLPPNQKCTFSCLKHARLHSQELVQFLTAPLNAKAFIALKMLGVCSGMSVCVCEGLRCQS